MAKQNVMVIREYPNKIAEAIQELVDQGYVIESVTTLFESTGYDETMEPTVLVMYRKKNWLGR